MTAERMRVEDPRVQHALEELRGLIQVRYPEATFALARGADDPDAIHLLTTVDVDDLDEVADLVIERELELQIDDGLPIHVIPLRPPGRVLQRHQAAEAT